MSAIDWSVVKRKPTKKELKLYNRWVAYLRDSRLNNEEIYRRARSFTEQGRTPNE